MALMIATIFADTIEREFKHGPLSPRQVKCLCLMAEQHQTLERVIDIVHQQNLKIMKYITLSEQYRALVRKGHEDFSDQYEKAIKEATTEPVATTKRDPLDED